MNESCPSMHCCFNMDNELKVLSMLAATISQWLGRFLTDSFSVESLVQHAFRGYFLFREVVVSENW